MPDQATIQFIASLTPRERAEIQALADKRNQSFELMAETIRKQREGQQGIIRNLR